MSEELITLMDKLYRVGALLHRYQHAYRRDRGRGGEAHRGQGRVLALLHIQPEITQRELSYLLDIRPQSLGELLSKLERAGMITRTPSEADKRVLTIRLTPEGEEAAAKAGGEQEDASRLLELFTPEEQAQLAEYLDRMISTLEEKLQEGEPDRGERDFRHGHPMMRGPDFEGHPGFGPYGPEAYRKTWDRGRGRPDGRRGPGGPHGREGCRFASPPPPPFDGGDMDDLPEEE